MLRSLIALLFLQALAGLPAALAQRAAPPADSVTVAIEPSYTDVSGFHRLVFGNSYRQEWATPTRMPVFQLANEKYATDYPANIGAHMTNTDSTPFMDLTPSLSLRENERGSSRRRWAYKVRIASVSSLGPNWTTFVERGATWQCRGTFSFLVE